MESNLDAAWIGLAGVLLGALAGFGGNYLITWHNAKLERKKLYRDKLEELHAEVDAEIISLSEANNSMVIQLKKGWKIKLLHDWGKGGVSKIDMLANMYASDKIKIYKVF